MNLGTVRATVGLGVAAMALIAIAGWMFLVGPVTAEVGQTRTEVVETVDRNLLLTTQLAALRAQAEDLSTTEAAARDLARLWPGTADQPGFFRAVNRAASTAGYAENDITALSPSAPLPVGTEGTDGTGAAVPPVAADPAVPATYALQTVSLSVEGSYEQAQVLLDGLERLPRSVLVQTVTLQAGSEDQLTLTVTGATFVAPPMLEPRQVTAAEPVSDDEGSQDPAAPGDAEGAGEVAGGTP